MFILAVSLTHCSSFLAEHYNCIAKFRYCHSVCLSVVVAIAWTRVYCDKMAEPTITRFLLKSSSVLQLCMANLTTKLDGVRLVGGVVFDLLRGAISRKRCEIQLRLQLIANRK